MENINIFSDLIGKVVVVTGGYGHLGSAMVNILSDYGCTVYVLGRSEEKFNEKFSNKQSIFFQYVDISKVDTIQSAIKNISEINGGRIDVLINNAYYGYFNHPEEMTSDQWRIGIEGGLNQVFDFIKETIPILKKSDNGKIINISSMYGVTVPDLDMYIGREKFMSPPNYGVAKAGIVQVTKYYAMTLAKYNINVNAISPGPFPSEAVQKDEVFVERLKGNTQLGRIGHPHDLNGLILLLSSKSSNYITGQNISVDGGWTI